MPRAVAGLHHVTAITASASACADFYVRVLGLRLVKRTVNFDAPGNWHLYFGNASGEPGTLLTFFEWPRASRGRPGAGMATSVAFAIPNGTLTAWRQRLKRLDVPVTDAPGRFGDRALALDDPDGLRIELVEHAGPGASGAIQGLHAVSLTVNNAAGTLAVLRDAFGWSVASDSPVSHRASGAAGIGAHVDVLQAPAAAQGRTAAGTIHHVAFRAADDAHQGELRDSVAALGGVVSDTLDRRYFRSNYFRESGGVLFEIATDAPGFAVDEPAETLGETLCLPPWLEERRGKIKISLSAFRAPARAG